MNQQTLISVLYDKVVFPSNSMEDEVIALVNDSRKVVPGCCFIAIRGEHFDGHDAIEQVIADGAKMVIVEHEVPNLDSESCTVVQVKSTFRAQAILANQFYQQPSTQLELVAVTGTNGKTTTSNLISQLLETIGHRTGVIGTLHYKIDQEYLPAVNTTPDALHLQELFHRMVEVGCQDAVIEASSHALALGRLWYTDVDCAIFTNLTREHLDFHKTMESYGQAKSLLFSQLGQHFHEGRPRLAIVNLDDPAYKVMTQATSADVLTYSLESPEATVFANQIETHKGYTHFSLHELGDTYDVSIPMRGRYNVSNFLAAYLCLRYYYQIDAQSILHALEEFKGVAGRMESIQAGQPFEVIVDFAHTTDALERVLQDIQSFNDGTRRVVTLMGHSGGNRDSEARPELGDILFKYSDKIIFTADNPRFEPVMKICQEMIGQHDEVEYVVIEDRLEAVDYAIRTAEEHDIILFAGKGGEPYQVIGDENVPYYEADEVRKAIERYLGKEDVMDE